jgi:AP2-associated kinase
VMYVYSMARAADKRAHAFQIYAERTQSEARRYQELPPSPAEAPKVGAVFAPPMQEIQIIPDIAPMRRGRPSKPASQHSSAKPSPSPFRGGASNDPFAVLDSGKTKAESADELSARFPTLDQFSLLHEKGGKFDFEPTVTETKPDADDLSQRITNALADDAFAKASSPAILPSKEPADSRPPESSRQNESPILGGDSSGNQTPLYQPVPQKPQMVSTGTMTETSPPPETNSHSNRPVYRFPQSGHERRPSSQPWSAEMERSPSGLGSVPSQTTTIHKVEPNPRSSSEKIANLSTSSRPSLDVKRPSLRDLGDSLSRPKSASSRSRPVSVYAGSKSDYTREADVRSTSFDQYRPQYEDGEQLRHMRTDSDRDVDRANITSDVDFLRAREEEESSRKKEKRLSTGSKHVKRSSLSFLSGRFGEAFRRFEQSNTQDASRTPSPDDANERLTPITGSEVTDAGDVGFGEDESTDISPEMRRELERRRLSQEEKRVAKAAAEYRMRVAGQATGGRIVSGRDGTKAPAIQSKVQSLLQNSQPPPKTASGYGRFTDTNPPLPARPEDKEYVPPLPVRPKPPPKDIKGPSSGLMRDQTASDAGFSSPRVGQRPAAPPKPKNLRTGGTGEAPTNSEPRGPISATSDDWEANFSRRFPSLSGLELVETEIDVPKLSTIRTREV